MSRTRIAGQITAASLTMLLATSFAPRPASPMVEGCVEYWDWKESFAQYWHGGPGEEPEIGWTYYGTYQADADPEDPEFDHHTSMKQGKADYSHDPCEGGDPD